jgi:hypothetical protein
MKIKNQVLNLLLDSNGDMLGSVPQSGLVAFIRRTGRWMIDHPVEALAVYEALAEATSGIAALMADERAAHSLRIFKHVDAQPHGLFCDRTVRERLRERLQHDAYLPGYSYGAGGFIAVAGRIVQLPPGLGTNQTAIIKMDPVNFVGTYLALVQREGIEQATLKALRQMTLAKSISTTEYESGFAPGGPTYVGVPGISAQDPNFLFSDQNVLFSDQAVRLLHQSLDREHVRNQGLSRPSLHCDARCNNRGEDGFFRSDALPPQTVFSSNWLNVKLGSLPSTDYGQVDVSRRPFAVTINRSVVPSRMEASLVHELMHVLNSLYKLNLTHEQVHDTGLFLISEVIPAVASLNRITNNN